MSEGGWKVQPPPYPPRKRGREKLWRPVEGVMKRGKVFDERGEVLTGDAQHAGVRDCAHGGRPPPVAQQRELPEIVAGMKPANRSLASVDVLEDLDLAGGDDVEAATQLALAHDALSRPESHRHHRVAPADWQWREVVGEHGGSHPVQHQGEPAPPGGHEREEKGAGNEGRRPAV